MPTVGTMTSELNSKSSCLLKVQPMTHSIQLAERETNPSLIHYGYGPTPVGQCFLALAGNAICFLAFGEEERALQALKKTWPKSLLKENQAVIADRLKEIFNREEIPPQQLLLTGTPFQCKVWQVLSTVPPTKIISYKDLAQAIEYKSAVRAVANANGRNPIAYLIPCHRVLRASGDLCGYRWGIEYKSALLEWDKQRTRVTE